jgi:hypothetical protein
MRVCSGVVGAARRRARPAHPRAHPPARPPAGKYLLVKQPNAELLRLYRVPDDAFETNYADQEAVVDPTAAMPLAPLASKADEGDD